RLHPFGVIENLKELLRLDLVPPHDSMRAGVRSLGDIGVSRIHRNEQHGSKSRAGSQVPELIEATPVSKQDSVKPLCKKLRRKRAVQIGSSNHDLCIGLTRSHSLLDNFALSRVVFDQQQTHMAMLIGCMAPRQTGEPLSGRSSTTRPR